MRIAELFEYVDEIMENPFSAGTKMRWLNQVEAEIQTDVLLLAIDGVVQYTEEDLQAELIVPPPYDNLYAEWIFWRICLAQQEAELANNYAVTYDRSYNSYVRFVCSTINPRDGMAEAVRYYLTAYQLAVKHGFVGTELEWIESLKGPEGEPGTGVELKGVRGSVAELPETAEPGTSYLVGNKENNNLYVYDDGWNDMGPLRGETGPEGKAGEKGEPFTYEDFTPEQLERLKGEPFTYDDFTPEQLEGLRGESGVEISETEPVDPDVDVWINPNGEGEQPLYYSQLQAASEAILAQAKASGEFDGKDGQDGKDGHTPVKGIDYFDGKDGLNGKDGTDGKDGKDGYTPVKGTDYWTADDQQTIIDEVVGKMPSGSGNAVQYVDQTLSDEQKAQARTNIGAIGESELADALNEVESGLSSTAKELLIAILRDGVYNTDQSENITALEAALSNGNAIKLFECYGYTVNSTGSSPYKEPSGAGFSVYFACTPHTNYRIEELGSHNRFRFYGWETTDSPDLETDFDNRIFNHANGDNADSLTEVTINSGDNHWIYVYLASNNSVSPSIKVTEV